MRFPDSAQPLAPQATVNCPFCRSAEIATTSKSYKDDAYWRCRGCGQIWNPTRLVEKRRWSGPGGYRS
jgi:transposase-like protein